MTEGNTKITVTMEKTIRVSEEFCATKEQIEQIENDGINPFYNQMLEKLGKEEESYLRGKKYDADIEYDYAIEADNGTLLADWD